MCLVRTRNHPIHALQTFENGNFEIQLQKIPATVLTRNMHMRDGYTPARGCLQGEVNMYHA